MLLLLLLLLLLYLLLPLLLLLPSTTVLGISLLFEDLVMTAAASSNFFCKSALTENFTHLALLPTVISRHFIWIKYKITKFLIYLIIVLWELLYPKIKKVLGLWWIKGGRLSIWVRVARNLVLVWGGPYCLHVSPVARFAIEHRFCVSSQLVQKY